MDMAVLELLKGDMGSRGLQGIMGPKGYRGDLGAAGSPGGPGRPGPEGRDVGSGNDSSCDPTVYDAHMMPTYSVYIRNYF